MDLSADFTVNSTADTSDLNPGDGFCIATSENCTIKAAVLEANTLAGADKI